MFTDIKKSFANVWRHPSLLAVLVLELLFLFLVSFFFYFLAVAVLEPNQGGQPFLFVVQLITILASLSVFGSGFFGMVKNVIQDGGTTLREFIPSVKRYWLASLGYFAVLLGLTFIAQLLFQYTYFFKDPVTALWLLIGLAVLDIFLTFYLLVWMPTFITFKDESFLGSLVASAKLSFKKWKQTLIVMMVSVLIVLLTGLLISLVGMGARWFFLNDLSWMGMVVEVFIYVIFCASLVVMTSFVFYRFTTVVGGARRRPTRKKRRAR